MKKSKVIGRGKAARTVGQIDFILSEIKDALFYILVPAYTKMKFDNVEEDDVELNKEIVFAVGRLYSSRKYSNCPECEKMLLVGAKSGYPFVHFHEFLKELIKYGA